MGPTVQVFVITAAACVGLLTAIVAGRRVGLAARRRHGGLEKGIGPAEGAVFALLGLLIAFTFSGAAARFDERRAQIAQEANAVGTALLRLDLLPAEARAMLRQQFARYIELRVEAQRALSEPERRQALFAQVTTLQDQIWRDALAAAAQPGAAPQATMLLVPALNEMFDIASLRAIAGRNHPPAAIFFLLGALALLSALLVGYDMSESARLPWLHAVVYALSLTLALFVILDLEFPRVGLLRLDAADRVMLELRESMR